MEEESSVWLRALSECKAAGPQLGRRLLLLGDDDHKAQLAARLQGRPAAEARGGNGLSFGQVAAGENRLALWALDGDTFYRPLLRYALDGPSLSDTTVLVLASMSRPWDVLPTVARWTRVLQEHLASLALDSEELERAQGRVLARFREYVEPGLSVYGALAQDPDRELEVNLGVELVVVVTGAERMRELRTQLGYEEEYLERLQRALRRFCLARGAALFYASPAAGTNCDHLLRYLLHRAFGTPFRIPGLLCEPDAVLVPSGWDTPDKIRLLSSDVSPDDDDVPPEEVVPRPPWLAGGAGEPEVTARRDQDFLSEVRAALERVPDAGDVTEFSRDASAAQRRPPAARRLTRAQSSPKKGAAEGAENTLSDFFRSLLTGTAPVRRPSLPVGEEPPVPDGERQLPDYFVRDPEAQEAKVLCELSG